MALIMYCFHIAQVSMNAIDTCGSTFTLCLEFPARFIHSIQKLSRYVPCLTMLCYTCSAERERERERQSVCERES